MAIISITAIPSVKEIVAGIPDTVSLTTNVPSMIFYTIDGTEPTTESNVYTGAIKLPTHNPTVILKAFATDGETTTDVLSIRYSPDISGLRKSRAKVTIVNDNLTSSSPGRLLTTPKYLFSQPAGKVVDSASIPNTVEEGYGANGEFPMRGSDEPIPIFEFKYSETDWLGRRGPGIGTLPAEAKILYEEPPAKSTNTASPTYDPRASVIFHDGTTGEGNDNEIFRPVFDLRDVAKTDGGTAAVAANEIGDQNFSGSLVNYIYNHKDNTVTFYYRCNRTNRWIISKEPAKRSVMASPGTNTVYLWKNFAMPSSGGFVFKWVLWRSTKLI